MLMSISNYMQWASLKWYQIISWLLLMFYHFVNYSARSVLYISFLPAGQLYCVTVLLVYQCPFSFNLYPRNLGEFFPHVRTTLQFGLLFKDEHKRLFWQPGTEAFLVHSLSPIHTFESIYWSIQWKDEKYGMLGRQIIYKTSFTSKILWMSCICRMICCYKPREVHLYMNCAFLAIT